MKASSVYFGDNQLERFKKLAKRKGLKRYAELIRAALEEYLDKQDQNYGEGER